VNPTNLYGCQSLVVAPSVTHAKKLPICQFSCLADFSPSLGKKEEGKSLIRFIFSVQLLSMYGVKQAVSHNRAQKTCTTIAT